MKKNLLIAAIAITALASCTDETFVGDKSLQEASGGGAISFTGGANRITRATSNTGSVAEMLDGQMLIYGVKKTASGSSHVTPAPSADSYSTVFGNYQLWSSATATTSNYDSDWEYVGAAGTHGSYVNSSSTTISPTVTIAEGKDQYIKYWDWSTDEYHFVAGSPVSSFTYNLAGSATADAEIASATVTGIAGHINPNSGTALTTNPVYIATPVKKVNGTDYNTDVIFSFTRQQAFVRVGVYETIPGYKITSIKFYSYNENSDAWGTTAGDNIVLASTVTTPAKYFQGASDGTATITYEWTTPSYTFDYTTSTLTIQKNWYGGAYNGTGWEMATSSTENSADKLYGTDSDRGTNGYFTVIPMKSGGTAQAILVKCDYTLKSLDTNEEINVSGATAAIPAAFTYWKPNTSYTYLFKISDNTNGKTGSNQPTEGLYPITFDAVVIAETSGTEQGIITTVSTPSITTYQEGSVTTEGIKYTYTSASPKPIYFTAQNDETGAIITLSNSTAAVGKVLVYKVAEITATTAPTEADLQITPPSESPITPSLISTETTVSSWKIPAGAAYFTPSSTGYYAIQYVTAVNETPAPTAYAYKIIKVEAE